MKRKKGKKGKFTVVFIVLFALIGFTAFYAVNRERKNMTETAGQVVSTVVDTSRRTDIQTRKAVQKKLDEKTEESYSLDEVTNVLLIGVDNDNLAGMDKFGNADGIMLVSINNNTKQLTLTSFMRDTRIRQPHEYEKKMTQIYHAGGAKLLVEALEQSFDVPVDYYVLVNYLNVVEIVDALGGMDVELSADEIKAMEEKIQSIEGLTWTSPGENAMTVEQAGLCHLNGIQTAGYLRIRPASTHYDSGRTLRARTVVTQILEKIKAMNEEKQTEFLQTFFPKLESDISETDLLKFSRSSSSFLDFTLYSAKIPLDGAYRDSGDGNFYVLPDFEVNNKYLYESIYEGKH